MIHISSMVKCEYPGCGVWHARHPLKKYCSKHNQLLLEVATKKSSVSAPPSPSRGAPPPPLPPPSTSGESASSGSAGATTKGRVRHGHRKQLETLKRKIAKRARVP